MPQAALRLRNAGQICQGVARGSGFEKRQPPSFFCQPSCRLPVSEIICVDHGGSHTNAISTFSTSSIWLWMTSRTCSVRYECRGHAGVVMVRRMELLHWVLLILSLLTIGAAVAGANGLSLS